MLVLQRMLLVIVIITISRYDGVVVGRLPFEPFAFFRGLTHRGLPGEDYRDCSSHLVYALSMMTWRTLGQKWMEVRGWKPKAAKTPSVW